MYLHLLVNDNTSFPTSQPGPQVSPASLDTCHGWSKDECQTRHLWLLESQPQAWRPQWCPGRPGLLWPHLGLCSSAPAAPERSPVPTLLSPPIPHPQALPSLQPETVSIAVTLGPLRGTQCLNISFSSYVNGFHPFIWIYIYNELGSYSPHCPLLSPLPSPRCPLLPK
jgi:hypothetical protein